MDTGLAVISIIRLQDLKLIMYMFRFYGYRRCRVSFFYGMVSVSAV